MNIVCLYIIYLMFVVLVFLVEPEGKNMEKSLREGWCDVQYFIT